MYINKLTKSTKNISPIKHQKQVILDNKKEYQIIANGKQESSIIHDYTLRCFSLIMTKKTHNQQSYSDK